MEKLPIGRPSKYKAEYADLAYKFALLGATDAQLAEFFDVNVDTIYEWKNVHEAFSESLKRGKLQADAMVSTSLFQRALGYSHAEDDIRTCDNQVVITPTIKHYPPDTTACIFWLKNRQRDKWREKQEQEQPNDVLDKVTELINKLPS